MRKERLRLKTIFVLMLLMIATIPILLTGVGTDILFDRAAKEEALADMRLYALSVSETLDVFFEPLIQSVTEVLYYIAYESYDERVIRRLLTIKLLSRSQFDRFFILDSQGKVEFLLPDDPGQLGSSMAEEEFFKDRVYDGYVRLSMPFAAPRDGKRTMAASASYGDRTIVGFLSFLRIENMLRKYALLPRAVVLISEREGNVLASTRPPSSGEIWSVKDCKPFLEAVKGNFDGALDNFDGKPSIIGTAVARKAGWLILVIQPEDAITQTLVLSRRIYAAIFGFGILLSLIASLGLFRTVLRPFEVLRVTVRSLAEGRPEPGGKKSLGFQDLDDMMRDVAEMAASIRLREAELLESREFFRTTLGSIGEGVMVVDPEGKVVFLNPEAERLTRWTLQRALGRPTREVLRFENAALEAPFFESAGGTAEFGKTAGTFSELVLLAGEDRKILVDFTAAPIPGPGGKSLGTVLVFKDVTERRRREESVKKSLAEKESLLKEIHHRVKNNLQIISSLLGLQEAKVKNKEFSVLLQESQTRVRTMALVHEKIYRSESLAAIDLGEYLLDLGNFLFHAYHASRQSLTFRPETEAVMVSIDVAVSCGLLVNEIITNSLKHAFPKERQGGSIFLRLSRDGDSMTVVAGDDGIGFPEGLDLGKTDSLGLNLISVLCRQLGAEISLASEAGTVYTLRIPGKAEGAFQGSGIELM